MTQRTSRTYLLHGVALYRAVDITWGMMLPGLIYFVMLRLLGVMNPATGVFISFSLILVGAGAGCVYGSRKYFRGFLCRMIGIILFVVMSTFATIGTFHALREPAPIDLWLAVDVVVAVLWLGWGAYLFFCVAFRREPESTSLQPPQVN